MLSVQWHFFPFCNYIRTITIVSAYLCPALYPSLYLSPSLSSLTFPFPLSGSFLSGRAAIPSVCARRTAA